jgi:hypothetical protein
MAFFYPLNVFLICMFMPLFIALKLGLYNAYARKI